MNASYLCLSHALSCHSHIQLKVVGAAEPTSTGTSTKKPAGAEKTDARVGFCGGEGKQRPGEQYIYTVVAVGGIFLHPSASRPGSPGSGSRQKDTDLPEVC